jgi:hypothetical protein
VDDLFFLWSLKADTYCYEWFDPTKGVSGSTGGIESSGGTHRFELLLPDNAVLYLKARQYQREPQ